MSNRHTNSVVEFLHAFTLAGVGGKFPAGIYDVETVDEQLDGLSFAAYRRISTTMTPRCSDPITRVRQTTLIEPADLDAALAHDRCLQSARAASGAPDTSSVTS